MIKHLYLYHLINSPSIHRRAIFSRFILSHFSPQMLRVGACKSCLTDHRSPVFCKRDFSLALATGSCVSTESPLNKRTRPPHTHTLTHNTHSQFGRKSPITQASPHSGLILILIRARFENEIKCLVHCEPPAPHCLWYHTVVCEQDGEALFTHQCCGSWSPSVITTFDTLVCSATT